MGLPYDKKMIEINLIPEDLKQKVKPKKDGIKFETKHAIYLIPAAFGLLIIFHIFLGILTIFKAGQFNSLNSKWQKIAPQRKELEGFNKEYAILSDDALTIQQLTEKRVDWAEKLNKLSLSLPPGVWFNELSVSKNDFTLRGSVVSLEKEEMRLIKKFIDNLKGDSAFFKDFNNLDLGSVQTRLIGGFEVTDFVLTGALKPK